MNSLNLEALTHPLMRLFVQRYILRGLSISEKSSNLPQDEEWKRKLVGSRVLTRQTMPEIVDEEAFREEMLREGDACRAMFDGEMGKRIVETPMEELARRLEGLLKILSITGNPNKSSSLPPFKNKT